MSRRDRATRVPDTAVPAKSEMPSGKSTPCHFVPPIARSPTGQAYLTGAQSRSTCASRTFRRTWRRDKMWRITSTRKHARQSSAPRCPGPVQRPSLPSDCRCEQRTKRSSSNLDTDLTSGVTCAVTGAKARAGVRAAGSSMAEGPGCTRRSCGRDGGTSLRVFSQGATMPSWFDPVWSSRRECLGLCYKPLLLI
jgi:hypothetical protein